MSLARLAQHLHAQGPGVVYTSIDAAAILNTTRGVAATYLRRAEKAGWLVALESEQPHGGSGRRPKGSVVARYVSAPTVAIVVLCPRCGLHPPRFAAARPNGRVPLCRDCSHARWQAKYRKRAQLSDERPALDDDLSAAAIDRLHSAALSVIRRRTWTSDSSL